MPPSCASAVVVGGQGTRKSRACCFRRSQLGGLRETVSSIGSLGLQSQFSTMKAYRKAIVCCIAQCKDVGIWETNSLAPTADLLIKAAGAGIDAAVILRVERQIFREGRGAETLVSREGRGGGDETGALSVSTFPRPKQVGTTVLLLRRMPRVDMQPNNLLDTKGTDQQEQLLVSVPRCSIACRSTRSQAAAPRRCRSRSTQLIRRGRGARPTFGRLSVSHRNKLFVHSRTASPTNAGSGN